MAKVYLTDKLIPFDEKLFGKLKLMMDRCTTDKPRRDALLNFEGDEGIGKTTFSVATGYIVAHYMKRPFSEKNVFFDGAKLVDFAKSTKDQVIIYDEPATDALNAEWWKETQKNLVKVYMMARKKRHFFIANLVKFWKFNEYLVVDRPLGMIHIYTRSDENQPRWVYIRKKDLEKLYNDYRKKKLRNYKKYSSFHGTFPDVLDEKKSYNILDSFNLEAYEAEKDRAILDIGKKAPVRGLSDLRLLRARIANIKLPITTQKDLAIGLGLDRRTIYEWKSAKDMDTAEGNAVREAELLK